MVGVRAERVALTPIRSARFVLSQHLPITKQNRADPIQIRCLFARLDNVYQIDRPETPSQGQKSTCLGRGMTPRKFMWKIERYGSLPPSSIHGTIECLESLRSNMPSSFINEPTRWRKRAEQMRALANSVKDDKVKRAMLRIARDYDFLAVRAEQRSKGSPQST